MEISNDMLQEMKQIHEESDRVIPNGYIPIELSSHGHLGAPKKFHIRNFTTEDLMGLVLADETEFESKLCQMIQEIILEDDVKIVDFHKKEVIETLVRLFSAFYQKELKELTWETLSDEDKKVIAKEEGGENTDAYKARVAAIERGEEKKQFSIDLRTLKYFELDDSFKSVIRVKKPGFECEYSFPRYGDTVLLRKFLMGLDFFKEGEKKFARMRDNLKIRAQKMKEWDEGKQVDLGRLPLYSEEMMQEFNQYETDKMQFATKAVKAIHLKSIDGKDISGLPLEEKLQYADDPRIDHATFELVSKAYEDMKVGIDEHIKVIDPYLNKVVEIDYPFRVHTLIQAIRDSKPDGTVIEFI